MSEGTEPLSLDSHSPPRQSPGLQGAELYRKLCSLRVPCQAWGMARGDILKNPAARISVPGKATFHSYLCFQTPLFSWEGRGTRLDCRGPGRLWKLPNAPIP